MFGSYSSRTLTADHRWALSSSFLRLGLLDALLRLLLLPVVFPFRPFPAEETPEVLEVLDAGVDAGAGMVVVVAVVGAVGVVGVVAAETEVAAATVAVWRVLDGVRTPCNGSLRLGLRLMVRVRLIDDLLLLPTGMAVISLFSFPIPFPISFPIIPIPFPIVPSDP